jgi:copper chaperone CopZ
MSRRRGEFEHRTSIFEGAFRAWSHLGGLLPEDLENKSTTDLDPLNFPLEGDPRLGNKKGTITYPDGTTRPEYPYEPLPRSGLAHPYVQAILSPWLGPDADNEAIQLGLTTLRTWWQHRRKGESGSATAALGTEKMKGVVEGYTRHFFTLAHCLVINDREQPPRTLHSKMKELEKLRSKRNKKRAREEEAGKLVASALSTSPPLAAAASPSDLDGDFDDGTSEGIRSDLMDSNLSPLERLHAAQRRQLAESGGIHAVIPGTAPDMTATPLINIKGKCMPGKVDLPEILEQVNHHASQLAFRGDVPMSMSSSTAIGEVHPEGQEQQQQQQEPKYGDPNTTPVVFVSGNGDIQISLAVNGITCAHCVKIVETVLKGCNGNKSPIDGLLDAAADRMLCSVLIKIDKASNAKRVAFESMRNLSMVGYTAKTKEMSIVGHGAHAKSTLDLGALSTAFEVIANTDSEDVFDWTIMCTCPDNGVLRDDCAR